MFILSLLRVSAFLHSQGPSRPILRRNRMSAVGGIVLQNSFLGCVQIFPGALVRSLENHVGGHLNSLISNRLPL